MPTLIEFVEAAAPPAPDEPEPAPAPTLTPPPNEHPEFKAALALRDRLGALKARAVADLADAEARHTGKHEDVRARIQSLLSNDPTPHRPLPDRYVLEEDVRVATEAMEQAGRAVDSLRRSISLTVTAERKAALNALVVRSYEAARALIAWELAQDAFLEDLRQRGCEVGFFRRLLPSAGPFPFDLSALWNYHNGLVFEKAAGPLFGTEHEQWAPPEPATTD